jgi:methylated-DNA-[protein]-cysteine S-methyltransferase
VQPAEQTYELAMESPVGWLGIRTDGSALTNLDILPGPPATAGATSRPAARRVAAALARYFGGDPAALADLPVAPAGTPFQRRVWQRLSAIPPGEALSYGALARELGTSARAVGGACRTNPIPLVIPCHRVVAADGLGGYSGERGGDWLAKKRWLLAHEGVPT